MINCWLRKNDFEFSESNTQKNIIFKTFYLAQKSFKLFEIIMTIKFYTLNKCVEILINLNNLKSYNPKDMMTKKKLNKDVKRSLKNKSVN